MVALLASHPAGRLWDAIADVLPRLKGAFSTVVMTADRVIAFRYPAGLRPLVLGQLGDRYCVASESCAFDIIGATLMRDVQPGEMVSISDRGLQVRQVVSGEREAFCVFEYIYFARPDSRMNGDVLQAARGRMGEILAREAPVDGDLVIAVPDSGNAAARGYARASGLPQDDGFVKNRYVARTFIQPGQELRKHGLRLKFNPLPEIVGGKRLVVVDDSIVRGNTTRQIVERHVIGIDVGDRVEQRAIRPRRRQGRLRRAERPHLAARRGERAIPRAVALDLDRNQAPSDCQLRVRRGLRRTPVGHHARTSGSSRSSANLPFASVVPASGYSPLKHASQWRERSPRTAS